MAQSRGFISRLLGLLLKTDLPLMKNVIKPLAESVLIKSVLIQNDEIADIIKIVKSLDDFGLLLTGVSERIQNEAKEQRGVFLSMLLGTFSASLLGKILARKGVIRARDGAAAKKQGQEIVRMAMNLKGLQSKRIFNAASSFN